MSIDLNLGLTKKIIEVCKIRGHSLWDTSYILATAYWESGRTMLPVREAYYLGSKAEAYRKKLRYYPWYGRGLVQLTWKENYIRAGKRLGVDFISNPDKVMEDDYAVRILVIGMEEGWFTSKDLDDFIDDIDESDEEDSREFQNARPIVNGRDKAAEIAKIALEYEKLLKDSKVFDKPIDPVVVEPTKPADEEHWFIRLIKFILKVFFR